MPTRKHSKQSSRKYIKAGKLLERTKRLAKRLGIPIMVCQQKPKEPTRRVIGFIPS